MVRLNSRTICRLASRSQGWAKPRRDVQILDRDEQISTLSEVLRVIRPGGWALFEGPPYREPTSDEIESGKRFGPGNRLVRFALGNGENWLYCHDESSLRDISHAAGIDRPTVYSKPWAGRERGSVTRARVRLTVGLAGDTRAALD